MGLQYAVRWGFRYNFELGCEYGTNLNLLASAASNTLYPKYTNLSTINTTRLYKLADLPEGKVNISLSQYADLAELAGMCTNFSVLVSILYENLKINLNLLCLLRS